MNKGDLIWVVSAEAIDNKMLRLEFNDGCVKEFDCRPLIGKYPAFAPLQDEKIFRNIALDGWTVTWNNGSIDIAPEHLYENGRTLYRSEEKPASYVAEEPGKYEAAPK